MGFVVGDIYRYDKDNDDCNVCTLGTLVRVTRDHPDVIHFETIETGMTCWGHSKNFTKVEFKPGDRVRVTAGDSAESKLLNGQICTVKKNCGSYYDLVEGSGGGVWPKELTLVDRAPVYLDPCEIEAIALKEYISATSKEHKEMTKFYRVIKDIPALTAGAIMRFDGDDSYDAISDLWNRVELDDCYSEEAAVVEGSSEYFERVYEVEQGRKKVYLVQAEAQAEFAVQSAPVKTKK
jgi:hypothetical protein